jgi:eukaryotic-like serine/threonine-protein kinase
MTAAASPASSPLAPGYRLDRYELLCPIAEGGMASVWVARQLGKHGFEKLVAIKTILPRFAGDVRFQKMFLDEARIAARLEHLNVAHILDLGEENDILYLAMEYVDGDALSRLHRACQRSGVQIPTGVVLRVLADTCAGLHEAHDLKDGTGKPLEIVHRDVSPHNVLISTRGIAKLIDFGIAKARSRVGAETQAGVLKGKIQYMAPEQALGRPVDRRADVWAVGAVLYQLLAGKPPYEADNQLETLHLLGSGRPPLPLPPAVHPAVGRLVRRALAHARENRYGTAAELGDAIEDAMVQAGVPTTPADVAAFSARHMRERAQRRRQVIDLALAMAAERQRAGAPEEPTSEEISLTGATLAPSRPRPILPLPSGDADPRHDALTRRDAPVSRSRALGAAVRLTMRRSTPSAARSYATLASAALQASLPVLTTRARSRHGAVAAVALVATVAGAAATGLSWAVSRSKAPAAARTPPAATRPVTEDAALRPAATGAATLEAPPDPSGERSPATGTPGSWSSPWRAAAPSAISRTPSLRSPSPAVAAQARSTTARPTPTVDDGF